MSVYITSADQSSLFRYTSAPYKSPGDSIPVIRLCPDKTFQEIEGFGAAITGASAYNLLCMDYSDRDSLLRETFDPEKGMGYSYIRISIGCSDFSLSEYTCCDAPGIENFALQPEDTLYVIPVLKEILAINSALKIMASPWTAPRWMKVRDLATQAPFDSWTSGQLNPAYYEDYALYFVKYIRAMAAAGVPVTSVTIQNEPLNRGNSASMYMTWQEQRDFIRDALGPTFRNEGIQCKIVVFDHNYNYDGIEDQQQYPLHIYEDSDAAQYIDGAAYHAYGGNCSELDVIHNRRPDKNLYFSEMSIGSWNYPFDRDLMWFMSEVAIGTLNRWNKAIIVWNFMLDADRGPNRPGGCTICFGAIDISRDYKAWVKNSHYYAIAHLSKVIKPGAIRIGASDLQMAGVSYSAFRNPDTSYGAVLLNENDRAVTVAFDDGKGGFSQTIPPRSVASFQWLP